MGNMNDSEMFLGWEAAGLAKCPTCSRLFKLDDGACDFCGEVEDESQVLPESHRSEELVPLA